MELGQNSFASAVSGNVRIGHVANAILAAEEGGDTLAVLGLTDARPESREGANLENIWIRDDFRARAIFIGLRSAHTVTFDLRNTPISARFHAWRRFYRHERLSKEVIHAQADYTSLLAELADSKGAPGSTRTQATWAAFRMRQMVTPRGFERFLLACYRLIGYGERPGPPLLLWALLVVVGTAYSLRERAWEWSMAGTGRVLETLGYWAVPSIGLLNQLEGADVPQRSVKAYFFHAIIAVPFLTGVLALRNFVKADRPNR